MALNGLSIFEADAYPNPFSANFKLHLNTSSEKNIQVKVYDMLGRIIENYEFLMSQIDAQEIGNELKSGVYNIIISQDDNIKSLRVIKR